MHDVEKEGSWEEKDRGHFEIDHVKTLITCIKNLQDMVYLDSTKGIP